MTPSCIALCASQGPPTRSPMAQTPSTPVSPYLPATTWVRSTLMPAASKPIFSTLPTMPIARITIHGQGLGFAVFRLQSGCDVVGAFLELGDGGADFELHALLGEGLG